MMYQHTLVNVYTKNIFLGFSSRTTEVSQLGGRFVGIIDCQQKGTNISSPEGCPPNADGS